MDKIRVFNPGPTAVVLDEEGHSLAPHDWAEVDPENPVVARHLERGTIFEPSKLERPEAPVEKPEDQEVVSMVDGKPQYAEKAAEPRSSESPKRKTPSKQKNGDS